jgi:hypothetical protein
MPTGNASSWTRTIGLDVTLITSVRSNRVRTVAMSPMHGTCRDAVIVTCMCFALTTALIYRKLSAGVGLSMIEATFSSVEPRTHEAVLRCLRRPHAYQSRPGAAPPGGRRCDNDELDPSAARVSAQLDQEGNCATASPQVRRSFIAIPIQPIVALQFDGFAITRSTWRPPEGRQFSSIPLRA